MRIVCKILRKSREPFLTTFRRERRYCLRLKLSNWGRCQIKEKSMFFFHNSVSRGGFLNNSQIEVFLANWEVVFFSKFFS